MTKQEILATYGKSLYQIRLEVAMQRYGFASGNVAPEDCLEDADRFIDALQAETVDELQAKF